MAQVQCQIENPKAGAELTVGQIFHLSCQGEWPELKKENLELRLEKADQYKLKLLGLDWISNNNAKLSVVSYQVGAHELKAVQIVDADQSVVLGDLKFTVASVMDPEKPAQEPFGPFGPFNLILSFWYPLAVFLVLAAVAFMVFFKWRIRTEKKKLLAEMRLDETAQDPYFQFYQVMRKAQRTFGFFSGHPLQPGEMEKFVPEMNTAYKIYLARKFQIPTLKWNERKILSDLKKNHSRFYSEFRLDIRKALAELSRAQAAIASTDPKKSEGLSAKDGLQLADLLRKQVDRIESWMKGRKQ